MPRARAPWLLATLLAAVAFAAAVVIRPAPDLPPFHAIGDHAAYGPDDDPLRVAVEPVLHAPWLAAPPWPVAALVAAASGAAVVLTAGVLGADWLAALLAALALAAAADARAAFGHASPAAVAALAIWSAALASALGLPLVALAAWLAAAAAWVPAVVMLPVALATASCAKDWPGRQAWGAAAVLAGALGAWLAALFVARAAAALAVLPAAYTPGEVLALAADRLARGTAPYADAGAAGLPAPLLLALGACGLIGASGPRRVHAGIALAAITTISAGWAWPGWAAALGAWLAWANVPLAAAGLSWLAASAPRPRVVTLALGALLVAGSLAGSVRPPGRLQDLAVRDQLAAALEGLRQDGAMAVVAEDTRTDSALVAWGAPRGVVRVAPRRDAVVTARAAGASVYAGSLGRSSLELLGFRLARAAMLERAVPLTLHRLTGELRCVQVGADRWSPLPGLEYTGRLGLSIPPWPGGRLEVIVGDAPPFRLVLESPDRRQVPLRVEPLHNGPGADAPPPDFWLEQDDPLAAPGRVLRARVPALADQPVSYALALGRRAPRVLARLREMPASLRARVCAAPLGPDDWFTPGAPATMAVALGEAAYFGAGWHGVEREGSRAYRWTARESVLLVPSARSGRVTVEILARPAADAPVRVTPTINGQALPSQEMGEGERTYRWMAPPGRWVTGTNEIQLGVSSAVRPADHGDADTRVLGLAVYGVTISVVP